MKPVQVLCRCPCELNKQHWIVWLSDESTAVTAFLTLLSQWDKSEIEDKLRQRVEFSERAIGKLLQAYDRLMQRNEKLWEAIKEKADEAEAEVKAEVKKEAEQSMDTTEGTRLLGFERGAVAETDNCFLLFNVGIVSFSIGAIWMKVDWKTQWCVVCRGQSGSEEGRCGWRGGCWWRCNHQKRKWDQEGTGNRGWCEGWVWTLCCCWPGNHIVSMCLNLTNWCVSLWGWMLNWSGLRGVWVEWGGLGVEWGGLSKLRGSLSGLRTAGVDWGELEWMIAGEEPGLFRVQQSPGMTSAINLEIRFDPFFGEGKSPIFGWEATVCLIDNKFVDFLSTAIVQLKLPLGMWLIFDWKLFSMLMGHQKAVTLEIPS